MEVGLVGLLMQSRCALRRRFVAADRKPIFWTTVLERANGKKTTLKTRSQFARFPRGTAPHYIHAMLVDYPLSDLGAAVALATEEDGR